MNLFYSVNRGAVIFLAGLCLTLYLVFPGSLYGPMWIFASFLIVISVLFLAEKYSRDWLVVSEKSFVQRLFLLSFFLRLLTMTILFIIAANTNGWHQLFYVGAKDSQRYFRIGCEASQHLSQSGIADAFRYIYNSHGKDISDTGFSSIISILVYLLGPSQISVNPVFCLLGSLLVVRCYRLASLIFENRVARLSGILVMLYPISWFYSSVMLKEGIMTLIIVEAIISITRLRMTMSLGELFKCVTLIILVFFFRSVASMLLFSVLIFSFLVRYRGKKVLFTSVLMIVALAAYLWFLNSTGRYNDLYSQYAGVEEYSQMRTTNMLHINRFVNMAASPVYAGMALLAPFPSFVKVPIDLPHNEYYYHLAGNLYWIILAFFSLYGMYHAIRYNLALTAPIWAFVIGYQIIMIKAMLFTSVRFSYPAKPLMLIMAAYGLFHLAKRKWYQAYLAGALVMVLVWNYVRLKGRI